MGGGGGGGGHCTWCTMHNDDSNFICTGGVIEVKGL